jgi:phosphoglycerol geranylgeranyltransferase
MRVADCAGNSGTRPNVLRSTSTTASWMNSSELVAKMSSRGPAEMRLTSRKRGSTGLAALIDPDNFNKKRAILVAKTAEKLGFSCVFIGGSTLGDQSHLDEIVRAVKQHITSPVILFPGNITGISRHADAILFSSLLNSTNTYFIVGAQALGAIQVNRYHLEAIPMGYLVFGDESTTSFIGQVRPIPYTKPEVAIMYALAAQYLGMRALYLEAGSGSNHPMPAEVVEAVRKNFEGLLIVGGGITAPQTATELAKAGADLLVIGNLLEADDFESRLLPITKALRDKLKH